MSLALAAALMIASGSVHAAVNAIVKGGSKSEEADPVGIRMTARASTDGASALMLLPAILFVALPSGAWAWLGASALVHVVYLYAMVRAYAVADYSSAYPVMRGSAPLLTAAVSVGIFGERVSVAALAGIAVVAGSMLALVAGRHLSRSALGWALLTGAMTALYTVADAHGVRAASNVISYIVWDFVLMGSESVLLFALLTQGRVFADLAGQWRPGATARALSIVTYGLALTALSLGPTAPLAALRETGMVTALLIALLLLGEAVSLQRALAVVGIVIGAAVILIG